MMKITSGARTGKARTETDQRAEAPSPDKRKRDTTCPALDSPYRTAYGLRSLPIENKSMD
ncbi:hypothetical protein Barb6XT_01882 [Bacteroidales bacterium Barb6XT]|nr:hypothetical protein Barb6XT_01882 [Bacteroidales bacterium Barb6XT]